jgi:hypothetical protein
LRQYANGVAATTQISSGSTRQRGADHFCQLGFAVRFYEQQDAGVEAALMAVSFNSLLHGAARLLRPRCLS